MLYALGSHTYKLVKTPLFWSMFVWPIALVGMFIAYYSVSAWAPEQKIGGYFQVLALVMPCLITVLCAYVAQQEQTAGACFNLLCVGKSRIVTFVSLFLLLAGLTAVGMLLASLGFYIFWGQMPARTYVLATVLMLVPLACLLLIQMFFAFRFGASWSVAVGALFLLVGALGVTGLFDRSWYYLPPVWAPRFVSLIVAATFYPNHEAVAAADLRYGLLFCVLVTVLAVALVIRWFRKWDGRPSLSDE